jgi:hypothetical protein
MIVAKAGKASCRARMWQVAGLSGRMAEMGIALLCAPQDSRISRIFCR